MLHSAEGYAKSKYTYPVVILPGVNHASFLSGVAPIKVQQTDLRATVSIETAIQSNAEIVSAFFEITINGISNSRSATKVVDHYIDNLTWPRMGPILKMFALEGNSDYFGWEKTNPIVNSAYELVTSTINK